MQARALFDRGTAVIAAVTALIIGLVVGLLAAPAESQPQQQARPAGPVNVVDPDDPDHIAAVDETGALKVGGFPETQDVRVTNSRSEPVPVSLNANPVPVDLNTFDLVAGPGEADELIAGEGFAALNMFFASVTGATNGETITFLNANFDPAMILRGEMASGMGQEDYLISLAHVVRIAGVRMECPETAGTTCRIFVSVTGY